MPKRNSFDEPEQPKKKTIYTTKLTDPQFDTLKQWCDKQMWAPYRVDYARFAFKGNKVNLVAYESGKLVIQGKGTEEFITFVLEPEITKEVKFGYDSHHHPEWFEAHAGIDESGKGDLFGPLVSTCVIADGDMVQYWMDEGVTDSKRITSDKAIIRLEGIIKKTKGVVIKTTFAKMEKYNELYVKFGSNLNKLLAWMHAKSLEEALKVRRVPWGMLDQFTKQPLVQKYFEEDPFELRMETKAESDPVVAAASIVARATYVRQMDALGKEVDMTLTKGASAKVKDEAKQIIDKLGPEALPRFAKMHFRTAKEVLGLPVEAKKPWRKY